MVKVITIRDEVYSELYKLKRAKGMSFSEIISYLIKKENEKKGKKLEMLNLAGTLNSENLNHHLLRNLRKW